MRRQKNSAEFTTAHTAFMRSLAQLRSAIEQGQGKYVVFEFAKHAFVVGHRLVEYLVTDKQVPREYLKIFERTVREFDRKTTPKDILGWFNKNQKSVLMLAESLRWPDKGAAAERSVASTTGLVIHNQTALDVAPTMKTIDAAVALMRDSGVPRIDEVIYGDVYLVGEVERKKTTAAKYFERTDTIRILVVKRFEDDVIQTIVHEFGHRYYGKILAQDVKHTWARHHAEVERDARRTTSVPSPKIGDVLETVDGPQTIEDFVPIRGKMQLKLQSGYISLDSYYRVAERNLVRRAYPTPYSATNSEEHFCEALAFFCMGELAEVHRARFVAIFGVKDKPEPTPAEPVVVKPGQLAMFNPRGRALGNRISRL